MKKVAILTTGHPPKDERIFHKIAQSLSQNGFKVFILCSTQEISDTIDEIEFIGFDQNKEGTRSFQKIKRLIELLKITDADFVHACEPMAVLVGFIYKMKMGIQKKVLLHYDVTEWYPENIVKSTLLILRPFKIVFGHAFNFIVSNLADKIILGEIYKKKRYDYFAPHKQKHIVSYYPILRHYNPSTQEFTGNEIVFGYAGVISVSRGLKIISDTLIRLKMRNSNLSIKFILAGRFEDESEKIILTEFETAGIKIEFYDWADYTEFQKYLEPVHICFDIRPMNGIYERSLPIKIFDYMALGKCIVASDYKPIRDTFEVANCGILVNPNNMNELVTAIEELLKNPKRISELGENGRKAAEEIFNWEKCEEELLKIYNS
ncbi:MAG: glycosyltransferase family 4 protein [Bacteroidetes bacterium]|nr:glycosyltransferase family 4 protein [Bacteroidota bacterium]